MFKLITLQDTIRIPPETFGNPLEKVGLDQVKAKYEGIVDEELGYDSLVFGLDLVATYFFKRGAERFGRNANSILQRYKLKHLVISSRQSLDAIFVSHKSLAHLYLLASASAAYHW